MSDVVPAVVSSPAEEKSVQGGEISPPMCDVFFQRMGCDAAQENRRVNSNASTYLTKRIPANLESSTRNDSTGTRGPSCPSHAYPESPVGWFLGAFIHAPIDSTETTEWEGGAKWSLCISRRRVGLRDNKHGTARDAC